MQLRVQSSQCTQCNLCNLVCAFSKSGTVQAGYGAIRIQADLPRSLKVKARFCLQCQQGYCIAACPRDALQRAVTGVVTLNPERCDTCQGRFRCVDVCKFGGMFVQPGGKVPLKCDLCCGDPECVKICPEKLISVVG